MAKIRLKLLTRKLTLSTTVYGHTGNAFDGEDGCVYLDAPLTYHNKVCLSELWFRNRITGIGPMY